jgi:tRNA uridine 5-carbamoylmethylation protein Kti12
LASENSVRFSGLTLAGPYGFGFAKNPNPIGPDPFRSLLTRFKETEEKNNWKRSINIKDSYNDEERKT